MWLRIRVCGKSLDLTKRSQDRQLVADGFSQSSDYRKMQNIIPRLGAKQESRVIVACCPNIVFRYMCYIFFMMPSPARVKPSSTDTRA